MAEKIKRTTPRKPKIIEHDPTVFRYLKPTDADAMIMYRIKVIKDSKLTGMPACKRGWREEELLVRRQVICEYMGQGLGVRRTAEHIADRWGISMWTAKEYVKDAMKYLAENEEEAREYYRDIQVSRLENILENAMEAGQYKEATLATEQLSKLHGLYTEKKDINITTEFVFGE